MSAQPGFVREVFPKLNPDNSVTFQVRAPEAQSVIADITNKFPMTKDEKGVYLVSGVTPRIFSMVSRGQVSPYEYMMEVVKSERYEKIGA